MASVKTFRHMAAARAALLYLIAEFSVVVAAGPTVAMVGGAEPADNEVGRSVVMLDGSGGTVCTATAIGLDLLLTAAHCVQPGSEYKLLENPASREAKLKDIVRIERHPQFELKKLFAHVATADVALVKLAAPLPPKIPAARVSGESETVVGGDALVVAGYGVTVRGAERLDGVARAATLVATGQPGTLQIRLFDPRTKGESAGLGACTGDSGAPAFRQENGSFALVGVVSWSTGPKLTAGCGGLTGVTPIVRYWAWIVDTARALGTPLAPGQGSAPR
jgi:secreted trypsin-like serine protease